MAIINRSRQISYVAKFVSFTQAGFLIGLVSAFVLSAYLQRGRFDQLFLFDAPDTPPVPGDFYSGPLGVHTFGDFLQPLWQSRLSPSPFIAGSSSYLPAANAIFWALSWFPLWIAFLFFISISLFIFLLPFSTTSNQSLNKWERLRNIIGGVLLTYPVLSVLDRGNIQLLTIGCVGLMIHEMKRERKYRAGLFLGIAIALKGYPLFFVILLLRRKMWRATATAIATTGFLTLIPLLLFDGGLVSNTRALLMNLRSSQEELSSIVLYSNNSLKALALSLQFTDANSLGQIVNDNLGLLLAILFTIVLLISFSVKTEDFEVAILISCVSTLTLGFSGGYVLLMILSSMLFIYSNQTTLTTKWVHPYLIVIAFILMPKQLPLYFWRDAHQLDKPSLASLFNPIALIALIALISARVVIAFVRNYCATET